ncbi:hydrolase TatD [Candidatus Fermentibacteria bacterium]|nr:MAG: hydrolase TatD [Candidatus Fermentibacteria bacterium]
MRLFDTHCHLFMTPLGNHLDEVLGRSRAAGVERLIIPSTDRDSIYRCLSLKSLPGVSLALGIHPWHADEGVDIPFLRKSIREVGACAIGEIGLDWKAGAAGKLQKTVFRSQLELAGELALPVILHCRNAFEEMLGILSEYELRGVIHAWSRSPELMGRFLDLGFHISFGGAVTRQGAVRAGKSACQVPSDKFVLETDSPSMGMSGIPSGESEPAHLKQVAEAMAARRGVSAELVALQSWRNSVELFGKLR